MRKSTLLLACATLLSVLFATGAAARECQYSAPRNADIDAAGLKLLAVDLGSNDLVIRGEPGLARITVQGTACASNEKWLTDVKIEAERHGDTASVTANNGNHGIHLSLFGGSYAYLKLDVRVPQSLAIKLKEGSGDADASGLAALDATLGSGDLKVTGVAGEFRASVGSGDVVASDVGSLNVSSVGSGDVTVDGVNSDAQVGSVSSGDLGLRNIKGKVSIGSVSSGDVKLAGIGGSMTVGSVGSGDVGARGVRGDVTIRTIGSGDVNIEQAGRNVRVDSIGSGDIGANGVGGDFSVGAKGSGDIHHHGVKGKVSVPPSDD